MQILGLLRKYANNGAVRGSASPRQDAILTLGVIFSMADDLGQELPLRERLELAFSQAQDSDRDSVESATLRLILCAVDDRDVSARERGHCGGCEESTLIELLDTMARQRALSADEYDEAGRIEEAERERSELAVIQPFLPRKLEGEALEVTIRGIVAELEATKLKDLGRCMQALKELYPGKIDTGAATKALREALG